MTKNGIKQFLERFYPIVLGVIFVLSFPVWKLLFLIKKDPALFSQLKTSLSLPIFLLLLILFLVFIAVVVIAGVLELILRTRQDYLIVKTATGDILLKQHSVEQFIRDTLLEITGVDFVDVEVSILKGNAIGLNIWMDSTEKNDYVRFSERIQQRVVQDLDFNFGVSKIRFFRVFLESTHIRNGKQPIRVHFK